MKQKEKANELFYSSSTLQRNRHDKKTQTLFKSNNPRKRQMTSNDSSKSVS